MALAGGEKIVAGDDGTSRYAQYVIYAQDQPIRVVLLNTDYYSGNGTRNSTTFNLSGLTGSQTLKAIRFTAASSEVKTSKTGENADSGITIGGTF